MPPYDTMTSSSDDQLECPLCMEPLEVDDIGFYPCTCGYQICRFCWHRLKTDGNGLCPACRKAYSENPAHFEPLSEDEIIRINKERRSKEVQKKQELSKNRRHLADVRVVQKNLVFVVGLSPRIADVDSLKKPEYFGKFGKIVKVVVNQSPQYAGSQPPSASAYVTYSKPEEALRAIQTVNNLQIDNRTLKASLGTTKYCSHFLKGTHCPKTDCMYLHDLGEEAASFTKEEMSQGKHLEYETRLLESVLHHAATATATATPPAAPLPPTVEAATNTVKTNTTTTTTPTTNETNTATAKTAAQNQKWKGTAGATVKSSNKGGVTRSTSSEKANKVKEGETVALTPAGDEEEDDTTEHQQQPQDDTQHQIVNGQTSTEENLKVLYEQQQQMLQQTAATGTATATAFDHHQHNPLNNLLLSQLSGLAIDHTNSNSARTQPQQHRHHLVNEFNDGRVHNNDAGSDILSMLNQKTATSNAHTSAATAHSSTQHEEEDLGFDPWRISSNALQDLIQMESNGGNFSSLTNTGSGTHHHTMSSINNMFHHPQHHLLQQQQHQHNILGNSIHSPNNNRLYNSSNSSQEQQFTQFNQLQQLMLQQQKLKQQQQQQQPMLSTSPNLFQQQYQQQAKDGNNNSQGSSRSASATSLTSSTPAVIPPPGFQVAASTTPPIKPQQPQQQQPQQQLSSSASSTSSSASNSSSSSVDNSASNTPSLVAATSGNKTVILQQYGLYNGTGFDALSSYLGGGSSALEQQQQVLFSQNGGLENSSHAAAALMMNNGGYTNLLLSQQQHLLQQQQQQHADLSLLGLGGVKQQQQPQLFINNLQETLRSICSNANISFGGNGLPQSSQQHQASTQQHRVAKPATMGGDWYQDPAIVSLNDAASSLLMNGGGGFGGQPTRSLSPSLLSTLSGIKSNAKSPLMNAFMQQQQQPQQQSFVQQNFNNLLNTASSLNSSSISNNMNQQQFQQLQALYHQMTQQQQQKNAALAAFGLKIMNSGVSSSNNGSSGSSNGGGPSTMSPGF